MMPSLAAGGGMPISAGGGSAGPSAANADNNMGFKIGAINMGSGNGIPMWLMVVIAIAVVWFLIKKGG